MIQKLNRIKNTERMTRDRQTKYFMIQMIRKLINDIIRNQFMTKNFQKISNKRPMSSDNETVDSHFHFMLKKISMPYISIFVKNDNMDPISMEYIIIYFFRNDSVKHTFLLKKILTWFFLFNFSEWNTYMQKRLYICMRSWTKSQLN